MAGKLATHQEIADLAGTEVDYPYKGNKMIVTEEYNQSTYKDYVQYNGYADYNQLMCLEDFQAIEMGKLHIYFDYNYYGFATFKIYWGSGQQIEYGSLEEFAGGSFEYTNQDDSLYIEIGNFSNIDHITVTFENQYYNIYDSSNQFLGYANSSYNQYMTINVYSR